MALISAKGMAPASEPNVPVVAMPCAARANAPQATAANPEPTEMRRTPRSASCERESSRLNAETKTLTGFGATAFTMSAISSGFFTPGA